MTTTPAEHLARIRGMAEEYAAAARTAPDRFEREHLEALAARNYAEAARRAVLLEEADPEPACREFARVFPTPNVIRAVDLAADGAIAWADVLVLFKGAAGAAVAAREAMVSGAIILGGDR